MNCRYEVKKFYTYNVYLSFDDGIYQHLIEAENEKQLEECVKNYFDGKAKIIKIESY